MRIAIAGRDPIVRTPRRNSRHDGAVHLHPIFGGVEIGAAAMASYVPRSTKLATSHAALVLMGRRVSTATTLGIFRSDQHGSKEAQQVAEGT